MGASTSKLMPEPERQSLSDGDHTPAEIDKGSQESPKADQVMPTFAPLDLSIRTTSKPQLFNDLGPAFFSPSPNSRRMSDMWSQHGGSLVPCLPSVTQAYENNYRNIPLSTVEELNHLVHSAKYIFGMSTDPIMHLIRNPYIVMYDVAWVGQCVDEGRLVSMTPYIITKPMGAENEVQAVGSVFQSIAKAAEDTRPPPHTAVSLLTPPTSSPGDRPWDFRNPARHRRPKRQFLIIQPYIRFHIPDSTIYLPSAAPNSSARHYDSQSSGNPTTIRPPYTLRTPPSRAYERSRSRQASLSPYPMCRPPPLGDHSSPPSSPLPTTPLLSIRPPPPVDYRLVADLPTAIRMETLSTEDQYQITLEIVDEADENIGQELHLWDGRAPLVQCKRGSKLHDLQQQQQQQQAEEEGKEDEEEEEQVEEVRHVEIREEESRRQADDEFSEVDSEPSESPNRGSNSPRPKYHEVSPDCISPAGGSSLPVSKNDARGLTIANRARLSWTREIAQDVPYAGRIRTISANLPISKCTRLQREERRRVNLGLGSRPSFPRKKTGHSGRARPMTIKEESISARDHNKDIRDLANSSPTHIAVPVPNSRREADEDGRQLSVKRKRQRYGQDEDRASRPMGSVISPKKEEVGGKVNKDDRQAKRFRV